MREPYHPDREQIDLAAVLSALSDPTRLAIVLELAETDEVRCGAFADALGTRSNLSYHYARLREAGITRARIEGTSRFISLRREDLDARFPGLLDSIITAARAALPERPKPAREPA